MNKRYLPVIASLLIVMTLTAFTPVFADLPTRLYAQPTLRVTTIAEDDELRQTGVMWMADSMDDFNTLVQGGIPTIEVQDLLAQFKIIVSYNGLPMTPTSTYCQFVEKDKANPLKDKQWSQENLKTVPKDNPNFICKFRWGKPGVGVVDVYYTGSFAGQYIADYILVVGVDLAVGRTTVWGTEIQDICLLGWPVSTDATTSPTFTAVPDPEGNDWYFLANPLGVFNSCEDIALLQQNALGITLPWT